jgi:hypothetical protein
MVRDLREADGDDGPGMARRPDGILLVARSPAPPGDTAAEDRPHAAPAPPAATVDPGGLPKPAPPGPSTLSMTDLLHWFG